MTFNTIAQIIFVDKNPQAYINESLFFKAELNYLHFFQNSITKDEVLISTNALCLYLKPIFIYVFYISLYLFILSILLCIYYF